MYSSPERKSADRENVPATTTNGPTGRAAIRWPPRVRKHQIRRLYESIPSGLLDEQLVDDVGISILMRCRAILNISRARRGEVICPICDREGREVFISRRSRSLEEVVRCPKCRWEIIWSDFLSTFRRRQFNEGGAGPAFRRFIEQYPMCRTPWEKMLAIDLVIHEFHYSLPADPARPTRACCVNLIEGKLLDVVRFLNELSGMTHDQPELKGTASDWKRNCRRAGDWHAA